MPAAAKSPVLRIALVAGEPSGDLIGAHLLAALKSRYPDARCYGIGGAKMRAQGFQSLFPFEKLAVNGFFDALRHAPAILGIRKRLSKNLLKNPPDLFIGIDAPDFNLPLERQLKQRGIATAHFISPSIWGWRGGRIEKIRAAVDHMLCLFPFEPEIYTRAGIQASFVGHPLASDFALAPDRAAARSELELPPEARIIALLPGSRISEVKQLAPVYLEAAKQLSARHPDLLFIAPFATQATRHAFEQILSEKHISTLPLSIIDGRAAEVMTAADLVFVASGTASLEAALCKRPMVICYRVGTLAASIYKRLLYLPWVGLPNILAGKEVVPELLQNDFTPAALTEAAEKWLADPLACQNLQTCFNHIHHSLRQDTAQAALQALAPLLDKKTPEETET